MAWLDQNKRKHQAMRSEAAKAEMDGVTFSPSLNERSRRLAERKERKKKIAGLDDVVEDALIQAGVMAAEKSHDRQRQQFIEECSGVPAITDQAHAIPRPEHVTDRLYSMSAARRTTRAHMEAELEVLRREASTPAIGATVESMEGSMRRGVVIEDELLAREAVRQQHIEDRLIELQMEEERQRIPHINPTSRRLAAERDTTAPRTRKPVALDEPTFHPEINAKSRELDRGGGMPLEERVEYLHRSRDMVRSVRVPTMREVEDEIESTFTPKITSTGGSRNPKETANRLLRWGQDRADRIAAAHLQQSREQPVFSHKPHTIPTPTHTAPTNRVEGVARHVLKQRRAREARELKEGGERKKKWRPRITVPQEFVLGERPRGRIAALSKPTGPARVKKVIRKSSSRTSRRSSQAPTTSVSLTDLTTDSSMTDSMTESDMSSSRSPSPTVLTDYSVVLASMPSGTGDDGDGDGRVQPWRVIDD